MVPLTCFDLIVGRDLVQVTSKFGFGDVRAHWLRFAGRRWCACLRRSDASMWRAKPERNTLWHSTSQGCEVGVAMRINLLNVAGASLHDVYGRRLHRGNITPLRPHAKAGSGGGIPE